MHNTLDSARDWTRTSMPVRAHGPEPCVSTNFTTRANFESPILDVTLYRFQGINLYWLWFKDNFSI